MVIKLWARRKADLLIHQLNAEDAGGLCAALAEGPLRPFLDQASLDGPIHVVWVQGSDGLHCLLSRAYAEAWGVHGGSTRGWGGSTGRCCFCQAKRKREVHVGAQN